MTENVRVALIAAVSAAITAIVPAYLTASARTDSRVKENTPSIVAQVAAATTGVPVGTVISSMLSPSQFARHVGDDGSFNTNKSLWVPADGRDVAGSEHTRVLGSSRVPDLRGLFIRGLNHSEAGRDRLQDATKEWADPESGRVPGVPQKDAFASHSHSSTGAHQVATSSSTAFWVLSAQTYNTGQQREISTVGGAETRPKNAALFYYIKIN